MKFKRKPRPSPAEAELQRIHALLDSRAVPQNSPDFPEVKMNVYGRVLWVLQNGVPKKPANSMEALKRLKSE